MRIRHYAQGKFYTIECPKGSTVVRRPGSHDILVVPLRGQEIRIPADPPELLPMLAETGNFGVTLAGEPVPEERMAGPTGLRVHGVLPEADWRAWDERFREAADGLPCQVANRVPGRPA